MIALLVRDLRLAIRAGGGFGLALAFFLIVVTLVPFGVGPKEAVLSVIAAGILWVGALLASLLSLDRIFALDWEDGSLDLLATAPVPLEGGRGGEGARALDHDGAAADAGRAGVRGAPEPAARAGLRDGGADAGARARRRCR